MSLVHHSVTYYYINRSKNRLERFLLQNPYMAQTFYGPLASIQCKAKKGAIRANGEMQYRKTIRRLRYGK